MAKMTDSEFKEAKRYIEDVFRYGKGTKEQYISFIKGIIAKYDDGLECAKRLDTANDKWTIF